MCIYYVGVESRVFEFRICRLKNGFLPKNFLMSISDDFNLFKVMSYQVFNGILFYGFVKVVRK